MELAAHLKKTGIKAEMHWAPRTANREADALANGDIAGFSPERRSPIEPDRLGWCVLPEGKRRGGGLKTVSSSLTRGDDSVGKWIS